MGQDAGLARAGAGEDQDGPFRVRDGLALRGVQTREKVVDCGFGHG
jgi:hypothetical protein